jgi:hypothetical protein
MMKTLVTVLGFTLLTLAQNAQASEVRKTVASFDITPCSRVTTYRDSFGIEWPTIQFARQSMDLNVAVNGSPELTSAEIEDTINMCDEIAIVVGAGAGALSANPGAFAAAYEGSFDACVATRLSSELSGVSVHLESTCHW